MDKIDLNALRARYNLVDFIARDTGQSPHQEGRNYKFLCPFHNENTPSFVVGVNQNSGVESWYCHGACLQGGDLLEYVRLRRFAALPSKQGFAEALRFLDSGYTAPPMPSPTPLLKSAPTRKLDMLDVNRLYHRVEEARPYFRNRAIVDLVIDEHRLGYDAAYPHYFQLKHTRLPDGRKFYKARVPRYAIPNLFGPDVRGIALRRDDYQAAMIVAEIEGGIMNVLVEEMAAQLKREPTLQDQIDYITGAKYKNMTGTMNVLFNAGILVIFNADGTFTFRRLPYILGVESQACAMAAQSLGYPCIAIPNNNQLDLITALQNVAAFYPVANNDDTGREKAQDWMIRSGRMHGGGKIIFPPKAYKDLDETAIDGVLQGWLMKKEGLEPLA